MLNINTAVSLDLLADDMIKKINEVWKNPFDSPFVIFPNTKMAQWFKLKWLEKYGSLANLEVKRLDIFIFESLINESESERYNLLTTDLLRNIIIAYLNERFKYNNDDDFFYEIKDYLLDNEGLNDSRLFDFADILAKLFFEYELTRPSDYDLLEEKNNNGIIDSWLNDKPFFFENKKIKGGFEIKEKWQKKIYFDIFYEDGLLNKINNNLKEKNDVFETYVTLPQLFRKKFCDKQINGSSHLIDVIDKNNAQIVFIFGFENMEQFYRNALKFMALKQNIYLYLTNPFINVTNKIENELLNYWGNCAKNNVGLWGKNEVTLLRGNNFNDSDICDNSDLHLLQKSIVENKKLYFYNSKNSSNKNTDDSLVFVSAPSIIREVEILHSNICKLLKEKKAKIKDIIVAAPDLDAYMSAIYQVFNQSSHKSDKDIKSKKTFLHIPYSFVDSSENLSSTYLALNILFSMKEKGYLARTEFFELVRNPVVQSVRGIEQEDIDNWKSWISTMSIYRDKKGNKSWLLGIKRLLLAKLSNYEVADIIPYSDIGSGDKDSLCRFIDCIEELENWIHRNFNEFKNISEINEAFGMINKWIFMKNVPKGFENENYVFRKIKEAKDDLIWQFETNDVNIRWKIFSKTLLETAKKTKYNSGNLFINGITFMKFSHDRIIPTKYLFLLGIDSKKFPRKDFKNSLDLRKYSNEAAGDATLSDIDKNAFLTYILNVKNALYISYVNKDLQKDEDYYPSSIIIDICRVLKNKYKNPGDWKDLIKHYTNSENREWGELFTQSALRNKEAYEILLNNNMTTQNYSGASSNKNETYSADSKNRTCPERVTVYQLRSFLEEPFKAKVESLLNKEEEEDIERLEFEPIKINLLNQIIINKYLVLSALRGEFDFEDEELFQKKLLEIITEKSIEFPEGKFGNKIKNELKANAKGYINNILSKYNTGYVFNSIDLSVDLSFNLHLYNDNNTNSNKTIIWNLSGRAVIVAENTNDIHIIDLVSNIKSKHYMNVYILALSYIASNANNKKVYIDLFQNILGKNDTVEIKIKDDKAREILNNIYKKMFIDNYHKVLPIDFFKKEINFYSDFIEIFEDEHESPWGYFSAKKLFDVKEVSGFCENSFYEDWEKEKEKQLLLFPNELKEKLLPEEEEK